MTDTLTRVDRRRLRRRTLGARRAFKTPMFIIGLVLLGLFAGLAFIHPVLQATIWEGQSNIYSPTTGHNREITHPSGPSAQHWLGTDPLGRDVVSLLTYSLRPSFAMAIMVSLFAGIVGLLTGTLPALVRGVTDRAMTRVSDALILLPPPLVFLVVARGQPEWGALTHGALYGILFGLGTAAVVTRSRTLQVTQSQFITAARASGAKSWWIFRKHLVPNVIPHLAAVSLGAVTGALVTQGFVHFWGGGIDQVGLGSMIYVANSIQGALLTERPWWAITAPAFAITFMAASFYLISAGLRQASDPRFSERR